MPTKVILKVNKGQLSGKEFSFDQKESLILGRQKDCNIVFPENTVSRYHCMMDIAPPSVIVRDFGSLNGTYLNGEKIGQRNSDMSVEEARKQQYTEFSMKAGDSLKLGKDCEIILDITLPQYCAECFCDIDQLEYTDVDNMPICADCYAKAREEEKEEKLTAWEIIMERQAAEQQTQILVAKEKATVDALAREKVTKERIEAEQHATALAQKEKQEAWRRSKNEADRKAKGARKAAEKAKRNDRRCKGEGCGAVLSGEPNEPKFCPACRTNPEKIIDYMSDQVRQGEEDVIGINGYNNIRFLGRGRMGAAWLVEEKKTGKQMALKLMLPQAAVSERNKEMFLREARTAGQLDHRNVVRQFKCGQSDDIYFILMEFCQGGSVDNLIRRNGGKLNLDLATHIILQVLDGLHYTHHAVVLASLKDGEMHTVNGVVHRDLKPGNIFLSDNSSSPTAKVADFGLAKTFETAGLSGHTRTGDVAGSVDFVPRQQIIDYRCSKPEVDVWAAAACYYHMLTGTYPKDLSGKDVWNAAMEKKATSINKRNVNIPKKLAEVIDAALIDDPDIGIQSALELKTRIEEALSSV